VIAFLHEGQKMTEEEVNDVQSFLVMRQSAGELLRFPQVGGDVRQ
jgi:hypothetical protein